jgi:integrase
MDTDQQGASSGDQPLKDVVDEFLQRGSKSGNYRSNLEYVLTNWRQWAAKRGVTTLDAVDAGTMADYSAHLKQRIDARQSTATDDDSGITIATAWTYYDNVSAFLDYCLRWEKIAENPAQKERSTEDLPERPSPNSSAQQFWSPGDRRALLDHVDELASTVIDEQGLAAVVELRDKALAYILAFTGVRAGEVLRDPRDERRNGIRWRDVHIEDNQIEILGKNQQRETAALPAQTHRPLEQLKRAVDPASDDWPVFVSHHAPSMYGVLPDDFERPDDDERSLLDHCRTHGVVPPALSTNGARTVMKRLCENAELEIDGEYMKPHGGRRGVGEKLFRDPNSGAAAAQRTLRHADPKTTSEMYSHIETSETAENVSEVFGDER